MKFTENEEISTGFTLKDAKLEDGLAKNRYELLAFLKEFIKPQGPYEWLLMRRKAIELIEKVEKGQ